MKVYGVQPSATMPLPEHIKRGMQNKFDELLASSTTTTTIQSDVDSLQEDLATAQEDITSLDGRVEALEGA